MCARVCGVHGVCEGWEGGRGGCGGDDERDSRVEEEKEDRARKPNINGLKRERKEKGQRKNNMNGLSLSDSPHSTPLAVATPKGSLHATPLGKPYVPAA